MSIIGDFFGCKTHCIICGEECDSSELDDDGVCKTGDCRNVYEEDRE